ncbi:MAG TPA: NDP-sugar synthase, partial [Miltoncostaeaceae bacterium]|nr:NDP-sugar synthase [Miltoncostaeaceae bacterium]
GGEGRRLRPLTDTRPKPMMQLVDRPFVAHQIDLLRRHGVTDVVFSCGYRPDALRAHFGDGAGVGVCLRYVVDPEPLGTAGAVANARPLLDDGDVLVLNGDILTDLDLGAVVRAHREAGGDGSIVLTPVADPSAYGLVRLAPDRAVREFVEKPSPAQLVPGEPYRINAGTYVLGPGALDLIPPGRSCSIEREIFPALAAGGRLFGHPSDAYWRDIGTHASYLEAHADVLGGEVATDSPVGDVYVGPGAEVAPGAVVAGGASLGAGCRIAPGAEVRGSVLGDGVEVEAGARVLGSVLGAGARVGEGALLRGLVVVGDDARVAAGVRLEGPCTVGTGDRVEAAPLGAGAA